MPKKKYWWGVDENYSSNFKFNLNTSIDRTNQFNNYDKILPELDVSISLLVDYDLKSNDYKWNSFGFPFINGKWPIYLIFTLLQR